MELLIQIGVFVALVAIGFFFGKMAERKHYRELEQAEAELAKVFVYNEKTPPARYQYRQARLVTGSVVVGEDYFKMIAAALKSLVGGRLTAYESLMDRGRREAVVRMKREAQAMGAVAIFNVRFETSAISGSDGSTGKRTMFSAEFLAYGTALVIERA